MKDIQSFIQKINNLQSSVIKLVEEFVTKQNDQNLITLKPHNDADAEMKEIDAEFEEKVATMPRIEHNTAKYYHDNYFGQNGMTR